MQDTVPDGLRPLPDADTRVPSTSDTAEGGRDGGSLARHPPAGSGAPPRDTAGFPYRLTIRFTGSGSEYFRIWIVNLLLILVTVGIYFPWAKVRKLQYFHGNTLVGDEPMGFHGDPRKMLKGYLLVGALFLMYSTAGQFSPVAGLIALVIVSLVSPALLRASLQFRLANTSWRGLRFHFLGSLRGVYVMLTPMLAFAAVGLVAGLLAWAGRGSSTSAGWLVLAPLLVVGVNGAMVWTFWRLKKYQHDHYALASLQTRFTAGFGAFIRLFLKLAGVGLLVGLVLMAAIAMVGGSRLTTATMADPAMGAMLALVPLLLALLGLMVLKPYFLSRLQNLVWSHTGNDVLQFHGDLRYRPLLWLTLKNWSLIVLTLGLYWPFAAIATARMRLEAVSVATHANPDELVSQMQIAGGHAAGDAAGDLFGLDIGL